MANSFDKKWGAAVLVIGDEILSGRTQDTNTNTIARFLTSLGIDLKEARVVGDVEAEIVAALNALRAVYDFVLTTGGIGPTHVCLCYPRDLHLSHRRLELENLCMEPNAADSVHTTGHPTFLQ